MSYVVFINAKFAQLGEKGIVEFESECDGTQKKFRSYFLYQIFPVTVTVLIFGTKFFR